MRVTQKKKWWALFWKQTWNHRNAHNSEGKKPVGNKQENSLKTIKDPRDEDLTLKL